MLRHLTRYFRSAMALHPTATGGRREPRACHLLECTHLQFEQSFAKLSVAAPAETQQIHLETDPGYISQYKSKRERLVSTDVLLETLRTRFRLTHEDVELIAKNNNYIGRKYEEQLLCNTLEALCLHGVNKSSFVDHPWLITMDKKRLEEKFCIINRLKVRDINHFVPFLRLSLPRLRKLVAALKSESDTMPYGNRIYYISQKLETDPYVVSKYLAKRLFILEMPFDMVDKNLELMLKYNISAVNILKDLWAFRYAPKSVHLRLERAKRANKDKIMPWMVRCPEPILQRSLKLSLDELKVLGEKSTVVEYVAERLQFSVDVTKSIMNKHPQVYTVRVTKIKEVLDYLLDEAGFNRYEIAQVPRILCHGLKTTKQRFEELKSLGCRPSTLVILCRSKREYDKFLKSWCATQQKINKPAKEGDKSEATDKSTDPDKSDSTRAENLTKT